MSKCIFVDLSRCTGCRGCQVACKQWKKLPAEQTKNWGSYQNPPDLSFNTLKLVRFAETDLNGKLHWLFFPEACRHCYGAPCKYLADEYDDKAIIVDENGAVIFTDHIKNVPPEALRESCPYDVPRANDKGNSSAKCDFCHDRVAAGLIPSCVLSCPTGAMTFGDEEEIVKMAKDRYEVIRKDYPQAELGDPGGCRVIYLYQTDHKIYSQGPVI